MSNPPELPKKEEAPLAKITDVKVTLPSRLDQEAAEKAIARDTAPPTGKKCETCSPEQREACSKDAQKKLSCIGQEMTAAMVEKFAQPIPEKFTKDCAIAFHFDKDVRQPFLSKLLADYVLAEDKFLHFRDSDELYRFDGGIYQENAEQYVGEVCNYVLACSYTTHKANETTSYIKTATHPNVKQSDDHEDNVPLVLIPLENGVYNLVTEKLVPYDSEQPFFTRLPINHDPNADCPRFKQFLEEVVAPGDMAILQEWLGYCLYRSYPFAKALLLVGEGHNGKSVFLNVVIALLGEENVSNESLQMLCDNRFAQAQLVNKYANIYADLGTKALWETSTFKILTGMDRHTVEKKNKHPFDTTNYAKLLFSCNIIPESHDDTTAYYRRFHIITFPNSFPEGDPKTDPNLLDKLKLELPGIVNYAIAGLQRLLEQNKFSYNKSLEETRIFYKRQSSTVAAYVEDCLELQPESELTKDGVYGDYCSYCRKNGLAPLAKPSFGKKLPQYIEVSTGRSDEKGRPRTWRGIRFKTEKEKTGKGIDDYSNEEGA